MSVKRELSPISVQITNFQSIGNLQFAIEGFTCIKGSTNLGKSAIMRAIAGALLNKSVVGLVRKGEKFSTVDLQSRTWGIKWEKGEKGINRYWLPGEDKPKDKLGQGQSDITVQLGFGSVKIGKDDLYPWYADQFHPVFLLDQTGPSVTDFISEVSHLEFYQDAILINVRNRSRFLQESGLKEATTVQLREAILHFDPLDNILTIEKELIDQLDSINKYQDKLILAESLYNNLNNEARAIERFFSVKDVKVPNDDFVEPLHRLTIAWNLSQICDSIAKSILTIREVSNLSIPNDVIANDLQRLNTAAQFLVIETLQNNINHIDVIHGVQIPNPILNQELEEIMRLHQLASNLETALASYHDLGTELPEIPDNDIDIATIQLMSEILTGVESCESDIQQFESQLIIMDSSIKDVESEIGKIPICPTCRQVITPPVVHQTHINS
jgi:hypothetical protein